jgi:hypothetical protein
VHRGQSLAKKCLLCGRFFVPDPRAAQRVLAKESKLIDAQRGKNSDVKVSEFEV